MTEETTVNATQEPFVFVALYKNVFERGWKKLISYKPGYIPKGCGRDALKTFPVGLWDFDQVPDGEFLRDEYKNKYWCSVAVNEDNRGDLICSLTNTENSNDKVDVFLDKTVKDWKTSYSVAKPAEIAGKRYWVNLTKNMREDKTQDLNLTFREAWESQWGGLFGTESDISFGDDDLEDIL